jgi:phospholipase C
MTSGSLKPIEHIVVAMMENRSFDNLLGWLYADLDNRPPFNLPAQSPTSFEGLRSGAYFNRFNGKKVFASRPPTAWPASPNPQTVPAPDPQEAFDHMTAQIFGKAHPGHGDKADMSGFLADYAGTSAGAGSAGQIMQSFGPGEAPFLNQLARSFAVCDHWYASAPCQTWPNRGFVHTGSSDGHLDNDDYELYDIPTIFNVLENHGKSWGVFHNTTYVPSLTWFQFLPQFLFLDDRFQKFDDFERRCRAGADAPAGEKLPLYSFLEPRFLAEPGFPDVFKADYPEDYHPPHNVCRGEQFLSRTYQAVRNCPYRDRILLVVTFDEHGGCYDHFPPPSGAAPPGPWPRSRDGDFDFGRFGVRVPTVVVSSCVKPGTVFRAEPGRAPYDHTSILATLRDWLRLDGDPQKPFLPSPRIRKAPTLSPVLALSPGQRLRDWPDLRASCQPGPEDESPDTPLSDLQRGLVAAALRRQSGRPRSLETGAEALRRAQSMQTYAHALQALRPPLP